MLIVLTFGLVEVSPTYAQVTAPVVTPPKAKVAVGPLNFTPTVKEYNFDGFLAKVIIFKDGAQPMHVIQPAGWTTAGSVSEFFLTNPQLGDSRITLRISSLTAPTKFDEPWIENTKPLILAGLPQGARIVNITPDALNRNSWTTIEFKSAYERAGKRADTGWMFVRLSDGRFLELIYSAPDEKFTQVRTAAHEMLAGWQGHIVQKGDTP